MSFFYGDGAGAAILTASDKPGFVSSTFFADGSYHKHWGIYSGGTFEPATEESVESRTHQGETGHAFPARSESRRLAGARCANWQRMAILTSRMPTW